MALTVAYADVQAIVLVIYAHSCLTRTPRSLVYHCNSACVMRWVSLAQDRQRRLHELPSLEEFPFCRMATTITPLSVVPKIVWLDAPVKFDLAS